MDAHQAIVSKRDTRTFTDEKLEEDSLRRVLQAGRMAGSSKNRQPIRFIVVRDRARKEELAKCGDFSQWIPTAPVNIAVVLPEDAREFDAGRAAQNLMVAANAEGLASCPVSMHHADCAREVLGLPENYRVATVVAVGRGPREHQEPRPENARRPLDEYVHEDRWQG
ncbi:MAG: nitroreductase family protein [Dehalococcoidia bacterium]